MKREGAEREAQRPPEAGEPTGTVPPVVEDEVSGR